MTWLAGKDGFSAVVEAINNHASLISAAVTLVYVVLTWCILREMRGARMNADVAATLVLTPYAIVGTGYEVAVRIMNLGGGTAVRVRGKIEVIAPPRPEPPSEWETPLLVSGEWVEYDLPLPEQRRFVDSILDSCQKVVVHLEWSNLMNQRGRRERAFELDMAAFCKHIKTKSKAREYQASTKTTSLHGIESRLDKLLDGINSLKRRH